MSRDTVERQPPVRMGLLVATTTLVLAATILLTAAVPRSPQAAGAPPAPVSPVSDDELVRAGEAATERICTECHPFDDIIVSRRTPKEWKDMVTQMATKGAIASLEQFGLISQYLTRFYGIVPVNTAAAADLAAVLGLSASEAAAVVEHRNVNGRFVDLAALLKVPGVDKAKIEADPDALKFN